MDKYVYSTYIVKVNSEKHKFIITIKNFKQTVAN